MLVPYMHTHACDDISHLGFMLPTAGDNVLSSVRDTIIGEIKHRTVSDTISFLVFLLYDTAYLGHVPSSYFGSSMAPSGGSCWNCGLN